MWFLIANVSAAGRPAFEAFTASQLGANYGPIVSMYETSHRPTAPNASSYLPLLYVGTAPELPFYFYDLMQTGDAISAP